MINEYDIKRVAKMSPNCWFSIDEEDRVVDKKTGRNLGTLSDFVQSLKKITHCDFEVLYSCSDTLEVIYRCKDCGAIIFSEEDENYDCNLCCPICGEYKTDFKYWSLNDIKNDYRKRYIINYYTKAKYIEEETDKSSFKNRVRVNYNIILYNLQRVLKFIKNKIKKPLDK